ncbi:MAG TPA: type III pantothenate kinase [Ignavibacteria bacterium]|nr:type III pantothenate kinase [Ignavibacteria bacterium]HMR39929.1 type III pantothenate kinase [Ignavibacteria bacterium]
MKNLIIDVGNSAIKICTGNSFSLALQDIVSCPYSKKEFEKEARLFITNYIKGKSFSRIGISVLNKDKKEFLKDLFSNITKTKPDFISRDTDLPFKIRYKEGLGNDRICSIAGALGTLNKSSILVIDFGTATTYTLMVNKILTGGVISPGINTSLRSLTYNTDLPDISLKFPVKIFTNNTKDNIRSGILYQTLFATEAFIKESRKNHPGILVAATGGLSDIIAKKTDLIDCTDKDLVLKGINFILQR